VRITKYGLLDGWKVRPITENSSLISSCGGLAVLKEACFAKLSKLFFAVLAEFSGEIDCSGCAS
jgi:hypothetical protein